MLLAGSLCLSVPAAHARPKPKFCPDGVKVSYCELVGSPEKYNGKKVYVRATYDRQFELSALRCIGSGERTFTWVDFPPYLDAIDRLSRRELKRWPGVGQVTADFCGQFESGGHYGHMGFPFLLRVESVKDGVVVTNRLILDEKLPASARKKLCVCSVEAQQ